MSAWSVDRSWRRSERLQREATLAALRNVAWHESGEMSESEWAEAWNGGATRAAGSVLNSEYLHLYREAVRRIEAAIS